MFDLNKVSYFLLVMQIVADFSDCIISDITIVVIVMNFCFSLSYLSSAQIHILCCSISCNVLDLILLGW